MMGWGYYGMGGGLFGMMLVPLILNEIPDDNSMEILNARFAKGEIDEEEYKRKNEMMSNG